MNIVPLTSLSSACPANSTYTGFFVPLEHTKYVSSSGPLCLIVSSVRLQRGSLFFSFAFISPLQYTLEYLKFQERVRNTFSLCPAPPYPQRHFFFFLCSCLAQASDPAFKSENRQPTYWPGMPHKHEWLAPLRSPKGAGHFPDISQAAGPAL